MAFETIGSVLAIIFVATYVQTVSGFGLGMVVMGAVTTLDLMSIADSSVIISMVAFMNSLFVIKGDFRGVDFQAVRRTCVGILPGLLLGLFLLDYLSSEFAQTLQLLLGITIIIAGVLMLLQPQPLTKISKPSRFMFAGGCSGLLAGLFSIGGPPLIFVFYRQPFDLKTIRLCLLSIFLVSSSSRLVLVGIEGSLSWQVLIFGLACMPVVMLASWVGKRFAPPLDLIQMRRVAFALLIVIGASLIF